MVFLFVLTIGQNYFSCKKQRLLSSVLNTRGLLSKNRSPKRSGFHWSGGDRFKAAFNLMGRRSGIFPPALTSPGTPLHSNCLCLSVSWSSQLWGRQISGSQSTQQGKGQDKIPGQ